MPELLDIIENDQAKPYPFPSTKNGLLVDRYEETHAEISALFELRSKARAAILAATGNKETELQETELPVYWVEIAGLTIKMPREYILERAREDFFQTTEQILKRVAASGRIIERA